MADEFGLLPTGLRIKTEAIIIEEVEAKYRELFGKGIPLGPDTALGKIIGIDSERESLLWELLEALNDAFDPDKATDNALDRIIKIIGLLRLIATQSTNIIYAAGTSTTAVPALTLFAVENTGAQFQSIDAVNLGAIETVALTSLVQSAGIATGTTAGAHGLAVGLFVFIDGAVISQIENVDVTTVADDTLYTVTINGVPFSITSDGSATDLEIRDALIADINAGSEPVTAAPGGSDSELDITADVAGDGFTISVTANLTNATTTANVSEDESEFNGLHQITATPTSTTFEYAVDAGTLSPAEGTLTFSGTTPINVQSVDTGAVEAPIGALNVIVNAISGLVRVENAVAATQGRNRETDNEAKIRRDESTSFTGAGSIPSIRARLRALDGVTGAKVNENKTDVDLVEAIAIIDVVAGAGGSFTISGNNLLFFPPDGPNVSLSVTGSTGNDGDYDVDTVALIGGDTRITVTGTVPSAVVDGSINIITLTPHSIEAVVSGGDDQEIAEELFAFGGGGIQTIGSSNKETVIDDGEPEEIRFSRPSDVDIDIEISFTVNPESDETPVDADIIKAVEDFGLTLDVGDDVIVDLVEAIARLSTPGIKTLDATLNGGSADIPISGRQQSDFTSVTIV